MRKITILFFIFLVIFYQIMSINIQMCFIKKIITEMCAHCKVPKIKNSKSLSNLNILNESKILRMILKCRNKVIYYFSVIQKMRNLMKNND